MSSERISKIGRASAGMWERSPGAMKIRDITQIRKARLDSRYFGGAGLAFFTEEAVLGRDPAL